jgi:hypothetical protein
MIFRVRLGLRGRPGATTLLAVGVRPSLTGLILKHDGVSMDAASSER